MPFGKTRRTRRARLWSPQCVLSFWLSIATARDIVTDDLRYHSAQIIRVLGQFPMPTTDVSTLRHLAVTFRHNDQSLIIKTDPEHWGDWGSLQEAGFYRASNGIPFQWTMGLLALEDAVKMIEAKGF